MSTRRHYALVITFLIAALFSRLALGGEAYLMTAKVVQSEVLLGEPGVMVTLDQTSVVESGEGYTLSLSPRRYGQDFMAAVKLEMTAPTGTQTHAPTVFLQIDKPAVFILDDVELTLTISKVERLQEQ